MVKTKKIKRSSKKHSFVHSIKNENIRASEVSKNSPVKMVEPKDEFGYLKRDLRQFYTIAAVISVGVAILYIVSLKTDLVDKIIQRFSS